MRHISILFIFLYSFFCFQPVQAAFYGETATGFIQLEKKYPYYLFVPLEYTPEKTWPLIVLVAERGEDPKETIEPWVEWAKYHKILVTAVPQLVPEHEVPSAANEWLIQVKREIVESYHVDPANIFLVGRGFSGHYAAYVGLNFPKEFSGIVSVGEAWSGPFETLMRATKNQKEQAAFYVAADPKAETYPAIEKKAQELAKKGYQVKVDTLLSGEDELRYRDSMLQWFAENAEARSLKAQSRINPKRKGIGEILENLFQM